METGLITKEDGAKQRTDVELTSEIAGALAETILSGKTLYPKNGRLKVVLQTPTGDTETRELSINTIHAWVKRDNVIPGDGRTLRVYLDETRAEKRTKDEQARQDTIRENAEKQLLALTGIAIKPVEVTKFYSYDEEGNRVLKREQHITGSAKLAEVVMKGLTFGLERLNPQQYGAKAEVQHSHFVFDLVRLSQARAARDAKKREELPV